MALTDVKLFIGGRRDGMRLAIDTKLHVVHIPEDRTTYRRVCVGTKEIFVHETMSDNEIVDMLIENYKTGDY